MNIKKIIKRINENTHCSCDLMYGNLCEIHNQANDLRKSIKEIEEDIKTKAQRSKQLLTLIKHIRDWSVMVGDLSRKVYINPCHEHSRELNVIYKQMIKSIEYLGIDYQKSLQEK